MSRFRKFLLYSFTFILGTQAQSAVFAWSQKRILEDPAANAKRRIFQRLEIFEAALDKDAALVGRFTPKDDERSLAYAEVERKRRERSKKRLQQIREMVEAWED